MPEATDSIEPHTVFVSIRHIHRQCNFYICCTTSKSLWIPSPRYSFMDKRLVFTINLSFVAQFFLIGSFHLFTFSVLVLWLLLGRSELPALPLLEPNHCCTATVSLISAIAKWSQVGTVCAGNRLSKGMLHVFSWTVWDDMRFHHFT